MAVEIGGVYATLGLDTRDFDQKIPAATKQLDGFAKQLDGKTKFAVQNLSFQLNDIATSLASGGSPFRVLAQQGGQIVQVFQQGGGVTPVLKGFASTLRGLITPTTLTVAGIAAVGVGLGTLLGRASSSAEQLRQFDNILTGFGTSSLTTSKDLQTVVRELRNMGIASEDADKAVKALVRNPVINPAQAGSISKTGLDIGARLGLENPVEGIATFSDAITKGATAVVDLGLKLGALSGIEAANILEMDRHGKQAEALNKAIQAVAKSVAGEYKNSLTEGKSAVNELTASWKDFLDAASDTSFIQGLRKALAHDLKDIADYLSGKKTLGDSDFGKAVGGFVPGGESESAYQQRLAFGRQRAATLTPQNSWLNNNAPFPTRANPSAPPIQWTDQPASGFDPANPWAADLWNGPRLWRSAGEIASSSRGSLGGMGLGGTSGAAPYTLPDQAKIAAAEVSLRKLRETEAQATAITKLWNVEQQAAAAATAERNRALGEGATAQQAEERAQIAAAETRKRFNIELGKENTLQDMRVTGLNKVADALKISEAAAIRETAAQEARVEALQRGGNVEAITARKIAEFQGRQRIDLQASINDNQRNADLVKLETDLQGQVSEKISYQLDLLRAKQDLEKRGVDASSEIGQNYLKSAEALAKQRLELATTQRRMDELREVADTLKGSFSTIFDTIVDGTFKLRNALQTLTKDIGRLLLNKAFSALLEGESKGGLGTGLFGALGAALGLSGASSLTGSKTISSSPSLDSSLLASSDFSSMPAFAGGGSFTVGGAGAIDSQLMMFRATPGEMVDIRKPGADRGGSGEVIRLELNHSDAFVSDMADQRIRTHSGTIVDVAVKRSQAATRRHFTDYGAEAQARRA